MMQSFLGIGWWLPIVGSGKYYLLIHEFIEESVNIYWISIISQEQSQVILTEIHPFLTKKQVTNIYLVSWDNTSMQ